MSEDQKLSRFILGLEGKLADEVEALRPVSLADALIRAKAKFKSLFTSGTTSERKREAPIYPNQAIRAPRVPIIERIIDMPRPASRPTPQFVNVNVLPIMQSGRSIQCYECKEWGHRKIDCPKKADGSNEKKNVPPKYRLLPPQNQGFQQRNFEAAQAKPKQVHQPMRYPLKVSTINHVSIKEEIEE